MLGDGGTQILSGVWTSVTTNFGSNSYFWGIIILLDFAIAAYRYHKTREVSEFVKTVVLMIIITVGVTLIVQWVQGGGS